MSKSRKVIIPLDVSDFVMAPETLIKEYGGMCALVYGRVWRYAQQESGICTASHSTIAKALGISRQTIQKYVALLVSEGYLREVTPDGTEHATKHYATTPALVFSGRLTATGGGTPVKKTDRVRGRRWKYSDIMRAKAQGSFGMLCIYCGGTAEVLDHWQSSAHGGSDDDNNLVHACIICNNAKGVLDGEDFIKICMERGWIEDDRHEGTLKNRQPLSKKQTTPVKKVDTKKVIKKDFKDSLKDSRKRKKRPQGSQKIHKRACAYFCEITGHELPEPITLGEKKAIAILWWNPMYAILDMVSYREFDAMELINQAFLRLTDNSKPMTIAGPGSLVKTCSAIIAEVNLGKFRPHGRSRNEAVIREWLRKRKVEDG